MTTLKRRCAELLVKDGIDVEAGLLTYQVRPYTIVEIYSTVCGKVYRGVGMAKQGKHDTWNGVLGYEIAYGRAVKQIITDAKLNRAF